MQHNVPARALINCSRSRDERTNNEATAPALVTLVPRVFVPFDQPCAVRNEDSRYEIAALVRSTCNVFTKKDNEASEPLNTTFNLVSQVYIK